MKKLFFIITIICLTTISSFAQSGTARTWAEILALLPDNTSGEISPQDLRDLWQTVTDSTGTSLTLSRAAQDSILTLSPISREARDSALVAITDALAAFNLATTANNAAGTAQTTADGAATTAGTALTNAATAQSAADGAQSDATQALADALTANTAAGNAQTTANNANTAASTAQAAADNAQSSADGVIPTQVGENGKFLTTDGTDVSWSSAVGTGDMLTGTYDPNTVNGDAFAMDNMVEGTDTKILTSAERSAIAVNTAKNTYPSGDATKAGHISVTQAVDLDGMETDIGTNTAKSTYPSGDATKVGNIAITQAVDLDAVEAHTTNTSNPHSVGEGDILPTQATHTGKYLSTDGTNSSWQDVDALPTQTGENGNFLTTDGSNASWSTLPGGGDMTAATYDPNTVSGDAFDMENMVEGANNKILTAAERAAIGTNTTTIGTNTTAVVTAQDSADEALSLARAAQDSALNNQIKLSVRSDIPATESDAVQIYAGSEDGGMDAYALSALNFNNNLTDLSGSFVWEDPVAPDQYSFTVDAKFGSHAMVVAVAAFSSIQTTTDITPADLVNYMPTSQHPDGMTVEFWYKYTATSTTAYPIYENEGFRIFRSTNNLHIVNRTSSAEIVNNVFTDQTEFHHIAVTWSLANGGRVWRDGVVVGTFSTYSSTHYTWAAGDEGLQINTAGDYIDDFRLSSIERYTTTFTPSTFEYSVDDFAVGLYAKDGLGSVHDLLAGGGDVFPDQAGQNGNFLTTDGTTTSWAAAGSGSGDMEASTYDPNTVAGDVFAMDNMVEGTTAKILTDVERAAILSNTLVATTAQDSADTALARIEAILPAIDAVSGDTLGVTFSVDLSEFIAGGNRTINLNSTMTASQIQDSINTIPKNLNGYTITVQFADGTYNLDGGIVFSRFFGGQISVYGNAADNTNNSTKSVKLNFNNGSSGLNLYSSAVRFYVRYLEIDVQDPAGGYAMQADGVTDSWIQYNSFAATGATSVTGLLVYGGNVMTYLNNIGLCTWGLRAAQNARVNAQSNTDNGVSNQPVVGIHSSYNATVGQSDGNAILGSSTNTDASNGGVIR